jgi:hypothetical protein
MLVTWNCHLQVSRLNLRWNLNPSRQIEVLTQLKISIWLIRAFIFNASKLFNSKHYPYDNDDMSLDKLIMKFTILNVKNALCKVELFEFIETLRCKCDNKWWNLAPHILTKAPPNKKGKKTRNKMEGPTSKKTNQPPKKVNQKGTSSSWTPLQWGEAYEIRKIQGRTAWKDKVGCSHFLSTSLPTITAHSRHAG